jgi:hypothetical protein
VLGSSACVGVFALAISAPPFAAPDA